MASFTDRTMGFVAKCKLTRLGGQNIDVVNEFLGDNGELHWVERKLSRIRLETEEHKRVVQRVCAPHCKPGLFVLKFHLLDQVAEHQKGFGSTASTNAASSEHFNVLTRQSEKESPKGCRRECKRLCRT